MPFSNEQGQDRRSSRRILVLFAHPALQKSRVNQRLISGLDEMEGVTFHDLYESYPDFCIDVAREQDLLLSHDVVVFHHPFFWYSTPAILKEWQDLVLEHGWAYGKEGTALQGKLFLSAVTTGGRETAYRPDGYNRHTVRELLAPLEQTAYLCGMTYLAPFVAHGTQFMTAKDSGFAATVASWHDAGVVAEWFRNVSSDSAGHARWRGRPAMTAIAKHLARDLDLDLSCQVTALAGDAFGGPRVEGAALSGRTAAAALQWVGEGDKA